MIGDWPALVNFGVIVLSFIAGLTIVYLVVS